MGISGATYLYFCEFSAQYYPFSSFCDVVAQVGPDAHHVRKVYIFLVFVFRVCVFFANVSTVSVGLSVPWRVWS